MASKKARQRISYVLDLPQPASGDGGGHRLGVSGLAIDRERSILYSGGRDGLLCAWDLNIDLAPKPSGPSPTLNADSSAATPASPARRSTMRLQNQAHTHWINDIALVQNNQTVVSASSDLTVKVWRPHSQDDPYTAHKIGEHTDFAKVVAAPPIENPSWVASGGLDRRVRLWDLNGNGMTLEFDVRGEEKAEKGSVYALAVSRSLIACGGPESVVRLMDPRSGQKVSKFVGHTDMIRDILLSHSGDSVLTASSDNTIKLWSVTAGRCMYTFNMHNESVWALASEAPDLGVFYSADRSGLIVKTDVRGVGDDLDRGLSLALAKENHGVLRIAPAGSHVWTSTASSSINRWVTVDTDDIHLGATSARTAWHDAHASERRQRSASEATADTVVLPARIPASSVLRISNTAGFPSLVRDGDAASDVSPESDGVEPIHHVSEETIEGQNGLVKHVLLNDRRRVLTLDTAGEVLLWDLIQGKPIANYAKRNIASILPQVNTVEAVAPWCSVDISSGSLTVSLEPFNCFDAEMYADELTMDVDPTIEFREDQRINLGKWVLRYLFAGLIDEEMRRDDAHRKKLNEGVLQRLGKTKPESGSGSGPASGLVMPVFEASESPLAPSVSSSGLGAPLVPAMSRMSQMSRVSQDDDVSSVVPESKAEGKSDSKTEREADSKGETDDGRDDASDKDRDSKEGNDKDKDKEKEKEKGMSFKKLRMGMSFGSNKKSRSVSSSAAEKPPAVDEKSEESETASTVDKEVDDSFYGTIQKMHQDYDKMLQDAPDQLLVEPLLMPSSPAETPTLVFPPKTKIIIQEETESGGSSNIYTGTVGTVGADADLIEQRGPIWLGDVLLLNTMPFKDPVKVSFVLHPWQDSLPRIAPVDGNNRLNANRMLRVRKVLAYVADKIDPLPEPISGAGSGASTGEEAQNEPVYSPEAQAEIAARPRPEEYLELYCNDQLLPVSMSLATLRAHVWKSGSDVVLYYKANGRRKVPVPKPAPMIPPEEPVSAPGQICAA
ncbi:hypothetical protein TD95_003759 [Thielaviopsis punctulata]|uniref:Uncharacterized protein n=1 Tax=Thielaviopsis punctulata TaxID=72032 RepID=A0A0F4Z7X7_9PEZI|nr:hypothetical protein TD95_003759 [Thielaviopsis punctulata]